MTDREKALADALQNIVKFYKPVDHDKVRVEQHNNCCPICIAQAALALPERSDAPPFGDTSYKIMCAQLYRSLERLSLAIEACGKIGFEESKPTTNEYHAAIWIDLNDAQKDAKLKLKHFSNAPAAPAGKPSDQDELEQEYGQDHSWTAFERDLEKVLKHRFCAGGYCGCGQELHGSATAKVTQWKEHVRAILASESATHTNGGCKRT